MEPEAPGRVDPGGFTEPDPEAKRLLLEAGLDEVLDQD